MSSLQRGVVKLTALQGSGAPKEFVKKLKNIFPLEGRNFLRVKIKLPSKTMIGFRAAGQDFTVVLGYGTEETIEKFILRKKDSPKVSYPYVHMLYSKNLGECATYGFYYAPCFFMTPNKHRCVMGVLGPQDVIICHKPGRNRDEHALSGGSVRFIDPQDSRTVFTDELANTFEIGDAQRIGVEVKDLPEQVHVCHKDQDGYVCGERQFQLSATDISKVEIVYAAGSEELSFCKQHNLPSPCLVVRTKQR